MAAASKPETVATLPLILDQQASRTGTIAAAVFVGTAATVLLAPFSLLAASAAQDPAPVFATLQQPAVAVPLAAALVVAVTFVALPLRRLLRSALQPATIVVSGKTVEATDAAGRPMWSEPLAAYHGIAHHIRSSLSGARHEIVLVHPDASRSVTIEVADRIAQARVDAVAALLDVAEIPARVLYQRGPALPPLAATAGDLKAA